jgi:mannose-6-phosphate isomerase-like protein (cupin superfamily)
MAKHNAAHIAEIPSPVEAEPGSYVWKPIRHHFGVRSFGVNLNIGPAAGDWVIEEHTEVEASGTRHEELFFVSAGRATFEVDGESVDAPAGTFVFVPDPAVRRGARAVEPGTTVLAIGGEPGVAYTVSDWESKYFPGD